MYVEQILYHCVNGNRTSTCILLFFFQFIIIIFTFRFFFSISYLIEIFILKKNGLLNVLDILRSVTNHSNMYIYLEN